MHRCYYTLINSGFPKKAIFNFENTVVSPVALFVLKGILL